MKKSLIALIIISSTLGAIAQLLLKTGMNNYGSINLGPDVLLAILEPFVLLGLITYFISSVSWIMVLSKADLSLAYPLGAINYVIVAIIGWTLLNETLSLLRIGGIGIIILGVYIVGKSQ